MLILELEFSAAKIFFYERIRIFDVLVEQIWIHFWWTWMFLADTDIMVDTDTIADTNT